MNFSSIPQISFRGRLISFERPLVMGIINATPDSFFAASRTSAKDVASKVISMISDGADIIDIGACSTRPGAEIPSALEEYDRLAPMLEVVKYTSPQTILSIDTFRADVARKCVENFDVDIINDISGGTLDPQMFDTIADLNTAYVLMHMRGTPQTMQSLTQYVDVTADVIRDLAFKIDDLHQRGVANIIADPGFGFAKTIEQNYQLLTDLNLFHELKVPVLVGVSRKSMICKPLDITPDQALAPTTALQTIALMNGANILRVHDVKEAAQCVKLYSLLGENCGTRSFSIKYLEHPHS